MQEIWDAVISFKSDKAPGPDGISVEFYKECFQVIRYDLRKVLELQKTLTLPHSCPLTLPHSSQLILSTL